MRAVRASSLGVLKDHPSIDIRSRCPLPPGSAASCGSELRSRLATASTRSVHAVSHDLDGLLHLGAAGLFHPAADHGIHHVSGGPGVCTPRDSRRSRCLRRPNRSGVSGPSVALHLRLAARASDGFLPLSPLTRSRARRAAEAALLALGPVLSLPLARPLPPLAASCARTRCAEAPRGTGQVR